MIDLINKSKCSGCHACQSVCPKNCISMESDDEGFLYPVVNKKLCINCTLCEKACPIIHNKKSNNSPVAYAAYNQDEKIRLDSSSGGVFTLIAEDIINRGGVVFGACFNEKFHVIHDYVETIADLSKFRGSKYVQSKIGDTYKKAKEFLDGGRSVLFTGTPCQIGGLKAYLKTDYDNLICQDIICHGVPSPKVWHQYVKFREKRAGSPARRIALRYKNEGWKRYSVLFLFNNETEYHQTLDRDLMMSAFLRNACLRPSCYDCNFKTMNHASDITLADFWGVQSILPNMDDDKGTSLFIIQSSKGQEIFDGIKDKMIYQETDINEAVKYNSSMIKSAPLNPKRVGFLKDIDTIEFDKVVEKYCSDSFTLKCKKIIYRVLSKIKRTIEKKVNNHVQH